MALIIPDSVSTTNAPPRVAFAIAKSKFQAAATAYEQKGGKPVRSRLRALEEAFDRVETTFMATLKDHPQRDEIGTCVEAFVKFGAIVTQLEREGVPAFHPASRIAVLDCFRAWEAAEKDYAAMGFKTVPARDLFLSLLPMGFGPKVNPPLYTFLMIERAPDEAPVYHAARFAALYTKELAGAQEAKDAEEKASATASDGSNPDAASSAEPSSSPVQ